MQNHALFCTPICRPVNCHREVRGRWRHPLAICHLPTGQDAGCLTSRMPHSHLKPPFFLGPSFYDTTAQQQAPSTACIVPVFWSATGALFLLDDTLPPAETAKCEHFECSNLHSCVGYLRFEFAFAERGDRAAQFPPLFTITQLDKGYL